MLRILLLEIHLTSSDPVSRGMRSRAVRALTLGFPNVGKSALINRLVNKKVVQSSKKLFKEILYSG